MLVPIIVNSSFQLPPLKNQIFSNRQAMFLACHLHDLLGTVTYKSVRMNVRKLCLDFKLFNAFKSLFCSSCSPKFWNYFWLEIISNRTTEANFTCTPDQQTSIFTCPEELNLLALAIRPGFFPALAMVHVTSCSNSAASQICTCTLPSHP